jgi:hypothetical protein
LREGNKTRKEDKEGDLKKEAKKVRRL